ncbi:unnamed protein product [Parascedosporium putredinis]|uniref:Carboxylic ester hydrolase n=1 Tax=Parascedosporium putredinis TaxID=1442378 RepID=A0A9P1M7G9_9PEZI|nr:unnamed protein product [Parascedosporium putredinis]CAI7988332.1 unnamed protein product [Parascedosporium putredinis]
MAPSALFAFFLGIVATASAAPHQARANGSSDAPTVQLPAGSYYGLYKPAYEQDEFLGIPYAQPPVGDLRFRPAQPLNQTWDDPRNATEYSPQCFGYGSDTWVLGNYVSEDCLTINVVRPHGIAPDAKLPVAVWIHGGGLTNGGASDPRYNLTFIVEQSVKMGTPSCAEVAEAGSGNLGFRDQRVALEWVNENIASFGGDPNKVTIWGESAGARSVATQLLAYGGRDDGLFRAAVMQSGTGLDNSFNEVPSETDADQDAYDSIVEAAGCSSTDDTLQCLRGLSASTLSDIFNKTTSPGFGSVVDGEFLTQPRSELVKAGQFVSVPILIGTNFDEGTQFGKKGIDTDEQWAEYVASSGASNATIEAISALYPDIPSIGLPATLDGRPSGDLATYGQQWKRVVSFSGDQRQHAARRWFARQWAGRNQTAYTYHFNVLVNGLSPAQGSSHFQEVTFVFNNVQGLGYETAVAKNPYEGQPETFVTLADTMSRMWVSFFTNMDPNYSGGKFFLVPHILAKDGEMVLKTQASCTRWPTYSVDNPRNMAFDVNATSVNYVEPDTFHMEQIEYQIGKYWGTDESLAGH